MRCRFLNNTNNFFKKSFKLSRCVMGTTVLKRFSTPTTNAPRCYQTQCNDGVLSLAIGSEVVVCPVRFRSFLLAIVCPIDVWPLLLLIRCFCMDQAAGGSVPMPADSAFNGAVSSIIYNFAFSNSAHDLPRILYIYRSCVRRPLRFAAVQAYDEMHCNFFFYCVLK